MKKLMAAASFSLILLLSVFSQTYTIQQYLNIKSASSPTFSPDAKHLAYLSNVSGTNQIWTIDLPNGAPRQLTKYEDGISFVRWLPEGDGIIFGKSQGGNENTQLYWMKPDGSGVRQLTREPSVRHNFGVVSDSGDVIVYASNKRNRQFFDIYAMDITSGDELLLYQNDGNNDVQALSPDGKKMIISRSGTEFSLDNDLYLIYLKTKQAVLLTPHKDAALFGQAHFVADGIVFAQNNDREFYSLSQMRRKNASADDWSDANRETQIIDNANWDVSEVEMNDNGGVMAYVLNRDGFSELYLRKYETDGKPLITVVDKKAEAVKLPAQGIVSGLTLSKDESKLAFSFSSANRNSDIWVYDLRSKSLSQVTNSDRAGIDPSTFIPPQLIKYKTFDGRQIPAWYYRPRKSPGTRSGRVIVSVHGGPEVQERPGFNALYQYYLSRGYAILATNVRGSRGYGKTFTHLDDVRKREDSVKDVAYAVEWLKSKGGADPKRIAVMGGSYGGYMTLAAITLYPDLWAAAVDTVGIANWESFLKETSGYRRRAREVEYGSLEKDLDFLRSISPLTKVDRIRTPLFVIAGRNDPRVPWTEGEQIANAIRKRNGIVEFKVYDDEGHGVAKLKNRLDLYPRVADFLDKYTK